MTEPTTPFDQEQLLAMSKRFPASMVKDPPQGSYGSYVPHALYTQRLLAHLGGYDLEMVEVIRGFVPEEKPKPKPQGKDNRSQRAKDGRPELQNAVVGALMRLTVTVDGQVHRYEDVGDCEDPHNWPHDGARLKDAVSDALKRCSARAGLGLHLYCKDSDDYQLFQTLKKRRDGEPQPEGDEA